MEDGAGDVRAEFNLSVAFDWRHFDPEQDIDIQCERYNGLCSLLHQAGELQGAENTRSKAVKQDVRELERILQAAKNAIKLKLKDLEKNVQLWSSEIAAHADPRWYRDVEDLTAYDDVAFMHIMRTMSIVDTRDFANYLMEALPRAVRSPKFVHPRDRPFLSKAMVLVRKLLQSCGDDYSSALPVALTMKTRVLPSRHPSETWIYDQQLDKIIKTLLRHYDLRIREDPDLFWNFAACFREVVNHVWQNQSKGTFSMKLIDALRDNAEVEIRRRTMVAINGRLPAELADLLVEFAMWAEEMPAW